MVGEAVDVEVAAWHSAICSKMKLQPGAKRGPFLPRITRNLPEPLWKNLLAEMHHTPRRCVITFNIYNSVKSLFSDHRVALSAYPQHTLSRKFTPESDLPCAELR